MVARQAVEREVVKRKVVRGSQTRGGKRSVVTEVIFRKGAVGGSAVLFR